jgi:hypothetical protein
LARRKKTGSGASGENRVESSKRVRLDDGLIDKRTKRANGKAVSPLSHYNRFFFLRKRTRGRRFLFFLKRETTSGKFANRKAINALKFLLTNAARFGIFKGGAF